jgi:hypothetical protein
MMLIPLGWGNFCGKAVFVGVYNLLRNTYIVGNLEAADRLLICKSNVDNLL